MGTGSTGALAAVLGFAVGTALLARGPLRGWLDWLSGTETVIPPSIAEILGVPMWVAVLAAVALVIAVLASVAGAPERPGTWSWRRTGTALGLLGVVAWMTGGPAGWRWGLSVTGPTRSLVDVLVLGELGALSWGTALILGVPLGTWVSARRGEPFRWQAAPATTLARRALGGVLMGAGGTLAAGCNIGNALTGLSILATNSLIATSAMVVGAALAIGTRGIIAARRVLIGREVIR